jgi:hypothetical protein
MSSQSVPNYTYRSVLTKSRAGKVAFPGRQVIHITRTTFLPEFARSLSFQARGSTEMVKRGKGASQRAHAATAPLAAHEDRCSDVAG